jgi:FtsP/CotA-like multicopper oxidase with cupredoxin domain
MMFRPGNHATPLVSALTLFGCAAGAGPTAPTRPAQPTGWADQIALRDAPDLDPSPTAVEVKLDARLAPLEIRPGVMTQMWTYEGGLPGPLIRAHVGDRVTVHFTNHLPEDSSVHWHGIRLPAAMDGVPGHTQPPVHNGGAFDYSYVVPDASLFWYHPHFDSSAQVGFGLYGPLLVEDPNELGDAAASADLGDPVVMVLSDLALDDAGALEDANTGGEFGTLFGREGDVLLVNGKVTPTIKARRGLRQRWRIVNSAKSRFYQLALDGHTFIQIGNDGGFLEAPVETEKLVVLPGGRADVVFVPKGAPGTTVPVRWVPYDRGFGSTFNRPEQIVFNVQFTDDPPYEDEAPLPTHLRTVEPIPLDTAITRAISLTQDIVDGKTVLGINGVPFSQSTALEATTGDTEIWSIDNTTDWDHPFHLHGFFFQPLDDDGAPLASPEWRDTFDVPLHKKKLIAVKYDDRAGMWMFHCHVLDHAEGGMMGMLMLHEKGSP